MDSFRCNLLVELIARPRAAMRVAVKVVFAKAKVLQRINAARILAVGQVIPRI